MEHVVFFPAQDGTPAFRRVASLEEAVRFVEHLRNVEGVVEASVHALTEVPLAFKAYYRVELPGAAGAQAPAEAAEVVPQAPQRELLEDLVPAQQASEQSAEQPQEQAREQAPELQDREPVEEPALASAAPSAKSLGFFA